MASVGQDDDVQEVSAGASETIPSQCGNLRKGGHVMLKGHPCKINEIKTSKVGKHGHAKSHITGYDIFTDKKYDEIHPTGHTVQVPNVSRNEYQVLNIDGTDVEILKDGEEVIVAYDEKLSSMTKPLSEYEAAFNAGTGFYNAVVLSAMGQDVIKELKDSKE